MGLFTVDLVKVLKKKVGDAFEPGEEILGAFNANPAKSLGKISLSGGIGSEVGVPGVVASEMTERQLGTQAGINVGMRSANKKQQKAQDAEGGLAATFPTGALTLAVTDRRIAVLGRANPAARLPKSVVKSYERGQITGIEISKKKMMNDVTVSFSDGTVVQLEAAKAQEFDRFNSAL